MNKGIFYTGLSLVVIGQVIALFFAPVDILALFGITGLILAYIGGLINAKKRKSAKVSGGARNRIF